MHWVWDDKDVGIIDIIVVVVVVDLQVRNHILNVKHELLKRHRLRWAEMLRKF